MIHSRDPGTPLAQWIEQQPSKLWVAGSNPVGRNSHSNRTYVNLDLISNPSTSIGNQP